MKGTVMVDTTDFENFRGNGRITIEKGTYRTRGIKLDIDNGSIFFSGPVESSTIDVLAIRKVDSVIAGVQVSGSMNNPVITLYSRPRMDDTDVLSYIVFGKPSGSDIGQGAILMSTAGALLSGDGSVSLLDRIKNTLGIEILEVESKGSDLQSTMFTVGKYLNPRLYMGFGRAIMANDYEFTTRYKLSEHWEVQTNSGSETRGSIYYKIQFD